MANAPGDGATLLFGSVGLLTIAPHMMKLGYDSVRDLSPIAMGVNFPNVLVVHSGVGVTTLVEYVALAKKKPGSLDFASTGAGSASHLAGELFNDSAGIDTVHIPYKSGAPALQDLLGGRRFLLLNAGNGWPAHRVGQADSVGEHGFDASCVPAQCADHCCIGLSRIQRDQLVCVCGLQQTPKTAAGPLEP